ncbi:hypothetical protein [Gordonia westfalica]|uniref:Uncharacterized protein n=1 Tax=Gordonia westfalica TaxID=158898 RepID=A0A1H2EDD6_9ACTN|nr:hypothetical protein [Gordonia westfalica]SDT93100.1 hypothetical protein SAMN04488548_13090 [Gordonia westfalica]
MSGLDDMAQARQKRARARSMPPPRHTAPAVSAAPATAPEPAPEQPDTAANAPAAVQASSPTKKKQPATPASAPSTASAATAASTTGRTVGPSTIYFDEPTDDWLEEVSIAGRRTKPRIDSRSAIARYAVRKLMNEMTPEQVIEAIRAESAATAHAKPGRPRH